MSGDKKENLEKVLSEVYGYSDSGDITEDETKVLSEMFDKPEKLVVLRKALRVLTKQEQGIFTSDDVSFLQAENKEKLADELIIYRKVDERIKNALVGFYNLIKMNKVSEKKKELEKKEKEEAKEEKNKEKLKEEERLSKQKFGDNL